MPDEKFARFSRKVIIVSFLLSVFVMYIHANKLVLSDGRSLVAVLNRIIASTIGTVGVPFFFLQSGYWMFRFNVFEEKTGILQNKLLKKIRTLGIPFVLWNTFGLVFFLIVTRIPGLSSMINEGRIVPLTLENVLGGIFLHQYYIVFWFMQDLIVVTAMSPVLLVLLRNRYVAYGTIAVLTVLYVCGINTPFFQTSSLLLFFAGGTLSVYHRAFWETVSESRWKAGMYFALFFLFAVFKWVPLPVMSQISVIVSPILFWKSCDWLEQVHLFDHEPLWFCKQSFFIYAAHDFPVETLSTIFARVSHNALWRAISYLATPLIVLAFLYLVARLLSRRLPQFYRLICGGRS